jgi:hypothetical protein
LKHIFEGFVAVTGVVPSKTGHINYGNLQKNLPVQSKCVLITDGLCVDHLRLIDAFQVFDQINHCIVVLSVSKAVKMSKVAKII